MYQYLETGVWPFRKFRLCEVDKDGKARAVKPEEFPIAGVTITAKGYKMCLSTKKGFTEDNILYFDIIDDCVVYTTENNERGFIPRNRNIISPERVNNSHIQDVDVQGDVIIAEIRHNTNNNKSYAVYSAKTGMPLVKNMFKSYKHNRTSNAIFFEQFDGLSTITTIDGAVLTTDCEKYERVTAGSILTLSHDSEDKDKLWLEGFDISKAYLSKYGRPRPSQKPSIIQSGVTNFVLDGDELFVQKENTTSIFSVDTRKAPSNMFSHKLNVEGKATRLAYDPQMESIYISKTEDSATLLNKNGNKLNAKSLKNLVDARVADEHSIVTTVKTDKGNMQGLVRTLDFEQLIAPAFDDITFVGKKRVVASLDDSFAMFRLSPDKVNYVPTYAEGPVVEVPLGSYFNPSKMDRPGVVLCEDAKGKEIVLSASNSGVKAVPFENYAEYRDYQDNNLSLEDIFADREVSPEQGK